MPPRWLEYEHCGAERYITSFGRILSDPEDMQRWRNYEARPCPGSSYAPLLMLLPC